jgi:hypothetical protein
VIVSAATGRRAANVHASEYATTRHIGCPISLLWRLKGKPTLFVAAITSEKDLGGSVAELLSL